MKKDIYQRRRDDLRAAMGDKSLALLPAAPTATRNRDVDYPYRQDSDFYYLTGFAHPHALAVLAPGRSGGEFLLFCQPQDDNDALWHGTRPGLDEAVSQFGADDAFPIGDLDDIIGGLLEGQERLYYPVGRYPRFDQRLMQWLEQLRERVRGDLLAPRQLVSIEAPLHEMRLYKSREEISVMRQAARVTKEAHCRAMRHCRPNMKEYEIEAELLYSFQRNRCQAAYPSIVGGGANACILHYTKNDATLHDGDLLLIDSGAEKDYYASDVTRTFPVNGRFNKIQRELYEIVLEAQQAAIETLQPGRHWNDPHDASVRVITAGLLRLGLLNGKLDKLIRKRSYKEFYMHHVGHWLGIDVHDVGDYKVDGQWRLLEAGMVMTVEPGIYLSPTANIANEFRGIGIRIEDNVLITTKGPELLTADIPRTVSDIEEWMRG